MYLLNYAKFDIIFDLRDRSKDVEECLRTAGVRAVAGGKSDFLAD